MGIYGDSLTAFSEQFRDVDYYNQDPTINAGFENKTHSVTKRVIIHSTGKKAVVGSNGNLVYVNRKEIWHSKELIPGYFVSFDNDVYRINEENNWYFEDGFYKYGISKVVGNDGTITVQPPFEYGAGDML